MQLGRAGERTVRLSPMRRHAAALGPEHVGLAFMTLKRPGDWGRYGHLGGVNGAPRLGHAAIRLGESVADVLALP